MRWLSRPNEGEICCMESDSPLRGLVLLWFAWSKYQYNRNTNSMRDRASIARKKSITSTEWGRHVRGGRDRRQLHRTSRSLHGTSSCSSHRRCVYGASSRVGHIRDCTTRAGKPPATRQTGAIRTVHQNVKTTGTAPIQRQKAPRVSFRERRDRGSVQSLRYGRRAGARWRQSKTGALTEVLRDIPLDWARDLLDLCVN